MKAGASRAIRFSYNFPAGETGAEKYVLTVIDEDGRVPETNETNNRVAAGPLPKSVFCPSAFPAIEVDLLPS